ncbi:MAG: hypothetical protein ABI947_04705 [Chloroflexota bacterium]
MKKASGLRNAVLLVIFVGFVIVACFLLIMGANYFAGYVVRGTRPIPADAAKFDPITTYPQIVEFAGTGTPLKLLQIEMKFVKADGTLDLTGGYGAEVNYDFAHVLDDSPTNSAPLGAGGGTSTGPYAERINVRVSQPGMKGGSTDQYYDFGLYRITVPAAPLTRTIVDVPSCNLKALWDAAIKQDAPANAVATIRYNSSGYSFSIKDTSISLQFDANCQLKK